jgi:hypothetical protein
MWAVSSATARTGSSLEQLSKLGLHRDWLQAADTAFFSLASNRVWKNYKQIVFKI